MDIKHKLLSSLEKWGAVPDTITHQTWEYYHSVYLIHRQSGQAGSQPGRACQSMVLKPLKLGAVKAFLVGELLIAGQRFFGQVTSGAHQPPARDESSGDGTILPVLIQPPGGRNYWWSGGNRYLLTGLIQGREADYYRKSDLQAAILAMRTFHRFTHSLIAENPHRWEFLRLNLPAQWRKRLREMEICREMAVRAIYRGGVNHDWCRQYLSDWPEFYEQAREVVGVLENPAANMKTDSENHGDVICYHDWAYHNVIIKGAQAFLIDFDDIIVDRPVHDRANLISRYLRLNSWSPASLIEILADFDRLYAWRSGELEWLWIYLAFPYEYWMLGRQYFIEKQPWSRNYYQDQWERKIACRVQRRRVLELLKTGI